MRDFLLTAPTAREIWVALNKSLPAQQGMREFALSERAASELWRALSASTAISTPQAPASSSSPAPTGAPAAPYVSEQDQIIAGILYQPPAGGWPPKSANQSAPGPGDTSRLWLAIGSKGQGYFIDNVPTAAPPPAGVPPWPYTGAGLYVVIMEAGGAPQQMRTNAESALNQLVGPPPAAQRYYQANFQADPTWNAAVSQVISGIAPDQVIANLQAQGAVFSFNAGQVAAAKAVADGFR